MGLIRPDVMKHLQRFPEVSTLLFFSKLFLSLLLLLFYLKVSIVHNQSKIDVDCILKQKHVLSPCQAF